MATTHPDRTSPPLPAPAASAANAASARLRKPLDLLLGAGLGKLLRSVGIGQPSAPGENLLDLADALLSVRGRASGPSLAAAFFRLYESRSQDQRRRFLETIHERHPLDAQAIDKAIAQWQAKRDEASGLALHAASKSPCRRLINLLNTAPEGTQKLLWLREDLLSVTRDERSAGLLAFDRELEGAFTAWFNAGFLELRRIGWDSPAVLLERIIRYEAVHAIRGWDDLQRRVEPVDRRCYAFFHPQMPLDPLIFVEVALTREVPGAIHEVIAEERESVPVAEAKCAIFYSISNCQKGLKGIPFGNHLIKRVVGQLREELPHIETFATLSPVPGLARWLDGEETGKVPALSDDTLRAEAARFLVTAKGRGNQPRDPVARFHLGNGARLEAIHANADLSPNGVKQSRGIMVNYLYDLDYIEANCFALAEMGTVATSRKVRALLDEGSDEESGGKRRKSAEAA